MKTIFISSFHSLISRNILHPILNSLTGDDVRVIVFVPKYKMGYFVDNFKRDNVIIEGVDLKSIYHSFFNKVFHNIFFCSQDTVNTNNRAEEDFLKNKNGFIYWLKRFCRKKMGHSMLLIKLLRRFDFLFCRTTMFDRFFIQYKPNLIFCTDIFLDEDVFLMREGIRHNISTIGMVRSWDNAISKGICRIIPNGIVVHNENIKKEMISIHGIDKNKIFISGIPHYDVLFNFKPSPRNDFFKKTLLDPQKKLILFSPAGEKFTDIDEQIFNILKESVENEKIVDNVQFLIRCHPTNYISEEKIYSSNNFIVERPGIAFNDGGYKRRELGWDDYMHLADSLYYSDIVINILSTIGIEAAIFDKPQIIIGFDGNEKKDYYFSIKRYHDDDHMSKFLKTGVAKIARSKEELIDFINFYLSNPKSDEVGRKRAVQEQCWDINGESLSRLDGYLKTFLN